MVHHPLLIIKVLLMDGKPLNILLTSWEGSNTGQTCSNIHRKNPHIENRIEPLNASIPKESLTQTAYNIYVQLSHNYHITSHKISLTSWSQLSLPGSNLGSTSCRLLHCLRNNGKVMGWARLKHPVAKCG